MCLLAVNFLCGRRQAGAGAEMERQGDQICQRNQRWKDGDGKKCIYVKSEKWCTVEGCHANQITSPYLQKETTL